MDTKIDLMKIQNSLLGHLDELKNSIQNAKIPASFSTEIITTSKIKEENFVRQFTDKLPRLGSHIYWIDVDKPSLLVDQFNNRPKEATYKCARNNKDDKSKYVYVGSCTKTKLGDRFRQHCGWGNDQTFSLQLKKWLTSDVELIFTFNYVGIEDSLVAQQLEDQLHRELKPLFGKPGGNNKIAALK